MLHDNDLTLVSGDGGEKDGKPVATAQNYVSTWVWQQWTMTLGQFLPLFVATKTRLSFLLIQNRIFSAGAAVAQRVERVGSWLEVRSFKSRLRAELSTP